MTRKKLLFVFSLNQTFHWFIIGLIIPVITLLQLEKGLDLFQIGIVIAVYSATIILLELPTGGLLGSLIMGYISNVVSIPTTWFIGAEILVISGLAYVFLPAKTAGSSF